MGTQPIPNTNTDTDKQMQIQKQIQIGWVGPSPDHSWERRDNGHNQELPNSKPYWLITLHTRLARNAASLLDSEIWKWWVMGCWSGVVAIKLDPSRALITATLSGTAWPNVPHAALIGPRLQFLVQIQNKPTCTNIQSPLYIYSTLYSNPICVFVHIFYCISSFTSMSMFIGWSPEYNFHLN